MPLRRKHNTQAANQKRRQLSPDIQHSAFYPYINHYLEWTCITGSTNYTANRRVSNLQHFVQWCDQRALEYPREITPPILERYQRHLCHRQYRGRPLSIATQLSHLASIRSFFKWCAKNKYILYDPASTLTLPKKPKTLPRTILSRAQVQQLLALPDCHTPQGLRDKALLETLYATGIRRMEATQLQVYDVHQARQLLFIRQGKGKQDRYVPLSPRASHWLSRYCAEVRPQLTATPDTGILFLTDYGQGFAPSSLAARVKQYLKQAGIEATGSCHLFRHAMATHMLENGADIRFIQTLLGHSKITTTEVYTQVSLDVLKRVHQNTHPLGACIEDPV